MAIVHGTDDSEVINAADGVTSRRDIVFGHDGDDLIYGSVGDDDLYGGDGDDDLFGGSGADYLNGGGGQDFASYFDSAQGVNASLLSGIGHGGTAEGDRYVGIECLYGSAHNDTLIGDAGDNVVWGSFGDDQAFGGDGADLLTGDLGNDVVKGGGGDDFVFGDFNGQSSSGGDDLLYGGTGRDQMTGGAQADTFVWFSTSETGITENTADFIWDFSPAAGDRIGLSFVDADVYAAGNQAFTFIGTAAFSGTPGEINYYHASGDTYIQLQTGTSADVEGVIRLSGTLTPEASWFVL